MQTPSSRFVALLLFCAAVAVGCDPGPPDMVGPEEAVTATETDPLSAKPACPGHPSCKEGDGDGDSGDPSSSTSMLTASGATSNALVTDGAQAADRKEKGRTLEYAIPAGDGPFAVWITVSDVTMDGVCATSGDFAAAGLSVADLKAMLQQNPALEAVTPVGDGIVAVDSRTTGPSDLNRIFLVWDPDPAVEGDFVARVPAEADLLQGVSPPSATITANPDGSRTITISGGVVQLTNRGAAKDWPTIECVNEDVVTIDAEDGS